MPRTLYLYWRCINFQQKCLGYQLSLPFVTIIFISKKKKNTYQSNSSRHKFGWLAQHQAKAMDETNSTTLNLIDFIVLLLPENNNKTLKPHIDIDRRNFNARQRFSGLSSFHKDISRTLLEIKMCLRQITIKNTIILSSNHTRALIFSK